jgi:hypothetical protein
MALVWERQQLIESGQNIYDYSVGGVEVSLAINSQISSRSRAASG